MFVGFAHLLLPWDDRPVDANMRLSDVGALLPYHSHVDPEVIVGALNRLIEEASAATIFYDIYNEAQKRADPRRRKTGLFFLRGKRCAPFALIAPGGGFAYVGSLHEGFPIAAAISDAGYNAFVLKYRVDGGAVPATEDMAAALSFINREGAHLGVSAEGYSLWGFSAGARMAAAIGSHAAAHFGGDDVGAASTVVMAYTGHSDRGPSDPPTFVVVGARDRIAPPRVMEARVAALRRSGVDVEYHRYAGVGHGFGLGAGTDAQGWTRDAIAFWARHMRLGRHPSAARGASPDRRANPT
ncbi:MAG: alpha/beta hydrolase [Pseudomonadota bacterium]